MGTAPDQRQRPNIYVFHYISILFLRERWKYLAQLEDCANKCSKNMGQEWTSVLEHFLGQGFPNCIKCRQWPEPWYASIALCLCVRCDQPLQAPAILTFLPCWMMVLCIMNRNKSSLPWVAICQGILPQQQDKQPREQRKEMETEHYYQELITVPVKKLWIPNLLSLLKDELSWRDGSVDKSACWESKRTQVWILKLIKNHLQFQHC